MRNSNLKELYGKEYFDKHRESAKYRPSLKTFLVEIMKHNPKRVLDVGCGHGNLVENLLGWGVDTIGLDFSEYAGERIPKERFVIAEAQNLPFPDKSFDVVYSRSVFEHIPEEDIDKVYSEMKRVGKHVMAEICFKNKIEDGHITIRSKEWWMKKIPDCQIIIRSKDDL